MALTYPGQLLTDEQRRAQIQIARDLVSELRGTWPLLDMQRLDATAPGWMAVVLNILTTKHALSAQTALDYLTNFREAEMGRTVKAVQNIDTELPKQAAVALLVTGPVKVKQQMSAGASIAAASNAAFKDVASSAILYVLDGGRDTIVTGVKRDRRALGWQRVTDGNPCYFCAMLASRGPVYHKNSFRKEVHSKCGCTLEPVYGSETNWAGEAQRYNDLWYQSTKGLTGKPAEKAWRHAFNETKGGTVGSAKAPITVNQSLLEQGKELNRQAQAAFRDGDDVTRIRLQNEASELFRQAYQYKAA